jgi:hypothetical protein
LTNSANFSRTNTLAFGKTMLLLRDAGIGREVDGLISTDGFLEYSLDDLCRLIGLRRRISCSASEPESEEVEPVSLESSASPSSSELVDEEGSGLGPELRVYHKLLPRLQCYRNLLWRFVCACPLQLRQRQATATCMSLRR